MRIGIATFGSDGGRSGIGQYVIHLLQELVSIAAPHEMEVLLLESDREVLAGSVDSTSVLTFPDRIGHPVVSLAWHQVSLPAWCRRRRYDVLFLAAANRRLPLSVPCPTVGTVHDLAAIQVEGKYDAAHQFYNRRVLPYLIKRLDRIVTVSDASRHDILRHVDVDPEVVHVIPNGVDHARFKPGEGAAERVRARHPVTAPYLLYVSRIEHPGKNHVRLIEAFARLKTASGLPHQLVLAGPDRERADEVHAAAEASGFADDIRFLGFVHGSDLPDLYAGADLFVFPSLYEGFGLPILEAMACGVPVATSSTSSMPEVAGDAALLFAPERCDEMASRMYTLLTDPAARGRAVTRGLARAAGYRWASTAAQTLQVLQQAAERKPPWKAR